MKIRSLLFQLLIFWLFITQLLAYPLYSEECSSNTGVISIFSYSDRWRYGFPSKTTFQLSMILFFLNHLFRVASPLSHSYLPHPLFYAILAQVYLWNYHHQPTQNCFNLSGFLRKCDAMIFFQWVNLRLFCFLHLKWDVKVQLNVKGAGRRISRVLTWYLCTHLYATLYVITLF